MFLVKLDDPSPKCAACKRLIKRGHLMCYGCWRRVPKAEQKAVNDAWGDLFYGSRRQTPDAFNTYRAAAQAAVNALRPAQAAPTTTTGEPS